MDLQAEPPHKWSATPAKMDTTKALPLPAPNALMVATSAQTVPSALIALMDTTAATTFAQPAPPVNAKHATQM